MTPDFRALCAELLAIIPASGTGSPHSLVVARARALLAEADGPAVPDGREPASVATQPSDAEIMELMPQQMHDDLAAAVRAMAEQEGIDSTPAKGVLRIILNRHVVDLARAVLARWGRQPAPPADGEVAELVEWLRRICFDVAPCDADAIARAADLLERLASDNAGLEAAAESAYLDNLSLLDSPQ